MKRAGSRLLDGRRGDPGRWRSTSLLAALLIAIAGCSSGGGSGDTSGGDDGGDVITPPIVASFFDSGTESSPNLVRLTGDATGDVVTLRVAITGPTTSAQLWAFAFDLVLSDETVASYIDGTVTAGPALDTDAGEDLLAEASQDGNRVTVGVSKVADAAGNGIGSAEEVVVSLDFLVERRATTTVVIGGTPPAPAALDPDLNPIPSVVFDAAPAAINGS